MVRNGAKHNDLANKIEVLIKACVDKVGMNLFDMFDGGTLFEEREESLFL